MLLIDKQNEGLINRITTFGEILRSSYDITLDLDEAAVRELMTDNVPLYRLLRCWKNCTEGFVTGLGVNTLSYSELEAITLNPAISNIALQYHRFEVVLPPQVYYNAMSGLEHDDCTDYRLDIIDTLRVPSIRPIVKRKLIAEGFETLVLPIRTSKELGYVATDILTHTIATNLERVKYDDILVDRELITNDVVKNPRAFNALMMLMIAGCYDGDAIAELLLLCDKFSRTEYITYLPTIPSEQRTRLWFDSCIDSYATRGYVAAKGKFNTKSVRKFIQILERYGTMADLILLYENNSLSSKQQDIVREAITPIVNERDFIPGMFDKYILDSTDDDIRRFVMTYRYSPSILAMIQSDEALARSGMYYMRNCRNDEEFLVNYIVRTSDVVLSERIVKDLVDAIVGVRSHEALILFVLSDNISTGWKEYLIENF